MSQQHITGAQYDLNTGEIRTGCLIIDDNGVRPAAQPCPDAVTLNGYVIYPAFLNAHDHLELNHFPRTRFQDRYDSAHDWGDDVDARLNDEPYLSLRKKSLADRLFVGGMKNLLSGATTVIHHGPPHRPLFRRNFPVRVLRQYAWAHSFHFSAEKDITRSYQRRKTGVLWFMHVAEGTDSRATAEYTYMKALELIGSDTVIVHGVGLTIAQIADAAPRIRALVWCPSTNDYLLGRTAQVDVWLAHGGTVAMGSDSKLTADGDLLDEVRAARQTGLVTDAQLLPMLYGHRHFNLPDGDVVILPEDVTLLSAQRRDIAAVIMRGRLIFAREDFPHLPQIEGKMVPAEVDGVPLRMRQSLAQRVQQCKLNVDGLTVTHRPQSRTFFRGLRHD